jgi:hypothetical protein
MSLACKQIFFLPLSGYDLVETQYRVEDFSSLIENPKLNFPNHLYSATFIEHYLPNVKCELNIAAI